MGGSTDSTSNDSSMLSGREWHRLVAAGIEAKENRFRQWHLCTKYFHTNTVFQWKQRRSWILLQGPLVAVQPHRPPMINAGTETAFRHNHCKHFQKSKHHQISGQRLVYAITGLHRPPKKHSPRSEFTPELHRWISKLTARHLQIIHQEIFWSPW